MKSGTLLQGKYRLLSLIAKGDATAVWRAEHQGLDAPIAVKLPLDRGASSAALQARLEAEAKTAAALRSPHVVQVFDFGVDEATQLPFIVMELLDGESLSERIARRGSLPLAEVARIVTHVARALSRAHELNVLHRDLEPSSIFLIRNGDAELAKVLGLGKRSIDASAPGSAALGTLPRTAHYMSPERIRESKAIDARTDLWSLAVIAVECLTGKRPFDAGDASSLALRICNGEAKLPSELGLVPPGLDAWFQRATALKPAERFASATEMAAQLQELSKIPTSVPVAIDTAVVPPPFQPALAAPVWEPPAPPAELLHAPAVEQQGPPELQSHGALPSVAPLSRTWSDPNAAADGFPAARTGQRWVFAAAGVLLLGGAVFALLPQRAPEPAAPTIAAQPPPPVDIEPVRPSTGIKVEGVGSGLTLLVDGKEFGPLPQELRDMEPGEHVIQVTGGPRYEVFQQRITVEAGRIMPIGPIRLKVTQGLATITAGEGAEDAEVILQVGNSRRVLPPLPVRLEVETDKEHVLTARRKGYATFEEHITFEDGQAQKTIEVTLEESLTEQPRRRRRPTPGASSGSTSSPERAEAAEKPQAAQEPARPTTLTLRSIPPSNVILDGKPLGATPRANITVEPGTHRVIFIHGESRKTETVEVEPGSSQTVSVKF